MHFEADDHDCRSYTCARGAERGGLERGACAPRGHACRAFFFPAAARARLAAVARLRARLRLRQTLTPLLRPLPAPQEERSQGGQGTTIDSFAISQGSEHNITFRAQHVFTCIEFNAKVNVHTGNAQICVRVGPQDNCPTNGEQDCQLLTDGRVQFENGRYQGTGKTDSAEFQDIPGLASIVVYTMDMDGPDSMMLELTEVKQYSCETGPAATHTPTPIPTEKSSRGVSSGVAALLFFFGLAVGIGGLWGIKLFARRQNQSSYSAM